MKKKLCPHPIPEDSTINVLENLIDGFLSPGKNGYKFETKEQFLETLTSFYQCPVCSQQRKLNDLNDLDMLIVGHSDETSSNLRYSWKSGVLQVYSPYYLKVQANQHVILNVLFTVDIPSGYVLQFSPDSHYLLSGLIITSPALLHTSEKTCFVSIYNSTDKIVEVSREIPLGLYIPNVLPKIKLSGLKSKQGNSNGAKVRS